MLKNLRKRNEGFTIIEVLIVLAIAGLIMLVVFLAVPALQRNSRNNQAKNAASAILATVNEYQDVNSGKLPTDVTVANGVITASGVAGTDTPTTGKTQGGYTGDDGTTMPTATGNFVIALGRKCTGNSGFALAPRAVAVGFLVETGNATPTQCLES